MVLKQIKKIDIYLFKICLRLENNMSFVKSNRQKERKKGRKEKKKPEVFLINVLALR